MIPAGPFSLSRRSFGAAVLSLAGAGVFLSPAGCSRQAPVSDAEEVVRIREMYDGYRKDFPNVPGITAEELMKVQPEENLVLVDVREPEEQQVSMIPGAISAKEFEAARENYRDSQIVVYCTIGARSGRYAAELIEDGFDARNLEGSILSWTHAGGSLVGPTGPTKEVHVYGPTWNLAADGYHAVW
jgi:rhodanese-related sulfurtransferase